VVTSSAACHAATPDDIQEEGAAHDEAYAEWLARALEEALPKVYRYEVSSQEW
jgi:hypothetical protein